MPRLIGEEIRFNLTVSDLETLGTYDNKVLSVPNSVAADMKAFVQKYWPRTKTSTCRVCSTQLNKFNRVSITDKVTGRLKYPSICNLDLKHASSELMIQLLAGDVSDVNKTLLNLGPQGSPTGKSDRGILQTLKEREAGIRNKVEYIRLTPEQAEEYKRRFQAKYRGISIIQMPYHNGRSMINCHCCRVMAWIQAVPETIVRILHEEDKLNLVVTEFATKEEYEAQERI